MYVIKPIPNLEFPKKVVTKNFLDEDMISLNSYFGEQIISEPVYYLKGIPDSTPDLFVRRSVAQRLEQALLLLPNHLTFKVFDAWRPILVQKNLYDAFYEKLRNEHMNLSQKELEEKTAFFVSKPSFDLDNPSVHNTGGAIDLTLAYKRTKEPLPMGTAFDDFSEKSYTYFFETTEQEEIKENRRLLYHAMTHAGFTNLPSEWWHYDYGTQFWSYYTKNPILYRGVKQCKEENK